MLPRAASILGTLANLVMAMKSFTGSNGIFIKLTFTVITATAATSSV